MVQNGGIQRLVYRNAGFLGSCCSWGFCGVSAGHNWCSSPSGHCELPLEVSALLFRCRAVGLCGSSLRGSRDQPLPLVSAF